MITSTASPHIILSLALSLGTSPQSQEEAPSPRLEFTPEIGEALVAEVDRYVERDLVVGGELLILHRREPVLHHAFGWLDRDEEVPWEPSTVCNVRSMTKPLTGMAVQILVDRGELELSDRVAEFIPAFDSDACRAITVEQLLTHRSGLPLTVLRDRIDEYDTLLGLAEAVGRLGPQFPPGSKFWYSDAGSEVAGAIVEIVTGQTLDQFITDEILGPLGMEQSFFDLDPTAKRRDHIAPLYYGGLGRWTKIWSVTDGPLYPCAWGSQSLYSTTTDYARVVALWMDHGRVGEQQILSPEALDRMLTPVSPMTVLGADTRFPTSFRDREVYYGQMAVLHVPTQSPQEGPVDIFGHSGSDGTIVWAWPSHDLIVLFFTQSRGSGAALRLEVILDRLLFHPETAMDSTAPPEIAPLCETYVANWASHRQEPFEIRWESGKLVLDIPTQMVYELVPVEDEPNKWHFAVSKGVIVWFDRDEDGAPSALRIAQGGLTFEAPLRGHPREEEKRLEDRIDAEIAAPYLGNYQSSDGDVSLEILVDDDDLAIQSPDGPLFHLWPIPTTDAWQVREDPYVQLTFQRFADDFISLTRHRLGEELLLVRRPAPPQDADERAIHELLEGLHQATVDADVESAMKAFATDAVMHGTALGERWDRDSYQSALAESQSYSRPPRAIIERHIEIDTGGRYAWFDEREVRLPDVELRGTGVLRRAEDGWQIVQLERTLLFPNELVRDYEAKNPPRTNPTPPIAHADDAQHALQILDRFHQSAASADADRYFACFTKGAIVLGTASGERWDVPAIIENFGPFLRAGQGWKATPIEQRITLAEDGSLAWFEEALHNATYPETRATGVLRKVDGQWKIHRVHVTFPMPNDWLPEYLPKIRESRRGS